MAGELGFAQNLNSKIIKPMLLLRGTDGQAGRDINIVQFCEEHGITNSEGGKMTMDDIFNDLGIDPSTATLDNLLTYEGASYLAPEIVRSFIWEGMTSDLSYNQIVSGVENVDRTVMVAPKIAFEDTEPQEIGETEIPPEAKITTGVKHVETKKYGVAITMSDESILQVTIPLLKPFLFYVGVSLAAKLFRAAVTVAINGDQADASDNCAVIGIADTTAGEKFSDYQTAWIRARRIAMKWDKMITNELKARKILQMDEFTKPQGLGGTKVQLNSVNQIIPSAVDHLITEALTDHQTLFFDQRFTLQQILFRALMVEYERIINRQINGTYATINLGWSTILRWARVIIDDSKSFSSYGFPSYMTPLV